MFWEQFLANYLSSVLAGLTLAAVGGVSWIIYKRGSKQKQNVSQTNLRGPNVAINAQQVNFNTTTKDDKEITKDLVSKQ